MNNARRGVLSGLLADFRALLQAPRELWLIYGVKLVESIAYFAVINVLILYLHDDLRLSDRWSGTVYGTWGTLISLVTFLSGFIADVMGLRKALLLGAVTLVIGRAMLMASEFPLIPMAGLLISVWGVASMKPVMTAAVKTVAPPELRAFAYNIFYVVMNIGAFIAGQSVSVLRRGLIGRAIRPAELLDGVGPAAASSRDALVERLVAVMPTSDGQTPMVALERLGKVATGGRAPPFWTDGDLQRVEAAVNAVRSGGAIAQAPFGLSGYELIFGVATLLSLLSLLLVWRMRRDPEDTSAARGRPVGVAVRETLRAAFGIGRGLFGESTFRAYMLFIAVLVLVRAIFVHAHSTWPTYMIREFGVDVPQAAIWSVNPLMIIVLTPLIGSMTARWSAWTAIMTGSFITAVSVLPMMAPELCASIGQGSLGALGLVMDYRLTAPVLFVVIVSIGESLWSPRLYEYVAVMAPPGREASYMGLTQLPMFAAKPLVGLMSGSLLATYCPEDGAHDVALLWGIFATTLIGPVIAIALSGTIRAAERSRTAAI
jgi:dipeptide/tripeptide permease